MKRISLVFIALILTVIVISLSGCSRTEEPIPVIPDETLDTIPAPDTETDEAVDTATDTETDSESDTEPETETETETETEPPETEPEVDRRAEYIYQAHPELTPVNYDSPSLLPISDDMGQEYQDKITFLCDSPTYWLWPYGMLKDGTDSKQIWTGPTGTMTLAYLRGFGIYDPYDGMERTIPEAIALHKPEFVIIALGINGISFMDEDYFTQEYTNLIDEIQRNSPDTIIVLQSIYPITTAYRNWGSITNATITAGNSWILKIAEQYGLKYLDTFSALIGEDGCAKWELMMDDGLHPNRDGLQVILDYIRTHGYAEVMK